MFGSRVFKVTIRLLEPLLGTVPKNREVYASYIASKAPNVEEELESVEDLEKSGWTGFHKDETGEFLFDYQIAGFLKEAGNTIKEILKVKALRSKIDQFVFVHPRKIRIPLGERGVVERPLRAQTAQGPRVALARSDSIPAETELHFSIELIPNKDITLEILEQILSYGQLKGLGQFRNGGYGRFVVLDVEEVPRA